MSRAATARRSLPIAAAAACLLAGVVGCTSEEGGSAEPGSTSPQPSVASGGAAQQPRSVSPAPTGGPCAHLRSAGTKPIARPERGSATVADVRVERHSCSDWVIIRLNGATRTGADVSYAAGAGTTLRVAVHAPGSAAVRPLWKAGQSVATMPAGAVAVRRVTWTGTAGRDSVLTVATAGRLPFALTWRPVTGGGELVLEVAHHGTA
jgi:hypothetical protein